MSADDEYEVDDDFHYGDGEKPRACRRATEHLSHGHFREALEEFARWTEYTKKREQDQDISLLDSDDMLLFVRLLILNNQFDRALGVLENVFDLYSKRGDMSVENFEQIHKCLLIKRYVLVQIHGSVSADLLAGVLDHIHRIEEVIHVLKDDYLKTDFRFDNKPK